MRKKTIISHMIWAKEKENVKHSANQWNCSFMLHLTTAEYSIWHFTEI